MCSKDLRISKKKHSILPQLKHDFDSEAGCDYHLPFGAEFVEASPLTPRLLATRQVALAPIKLLRQLYGGKTHVALY